MSPVLFDSGGGGGAVKPGVRMSPAYAGTLRAKARIAAVQIALRVFMVFSPVKFFCSVKQLEHEGGTQLHGSLTRRIIAASSPVRKDFCIACFEGVIQLALDFPGMKKLVCALSRAPLPGIRQDTSRQVAH